MGLRYAVDRLRFRKRYPEIARLEDADMDVDLEASIVLVQGLSCRKNLAQLIPTDIHAVWRMRLGEWTQQISIDWPDGVDQTAFFYGYLAARDSIFGQAPDARRSDEMRLADCFRVYDELSKAQMTAKAGPAGCAIARHIVSQVVAYQEDESGFAGAAAIVLMGEGFAAIDAVLARTASRN